VHWRRPRATEKKGKAQKSNTTSKEMKKKKVKLKDARESMVGEQQRKLEGGGLEPKRTALRRSGGQKRRATLRGGRGTSGKEFSGCQKRKKQDVSGKELGLLSHGEKRVKRPGESLSKLFKKRRLLSVS